MGFVLIIAGFAVYWNSLPAPFTFDDEHAIVINEQIRRLSTSLSPTEQGSPLAGRPLVSVSFAINYALGGLNVRGYRLVNIAIHVINALLLWVTGAVAGSLGLGLHVDGFVPAFLGALVIGITRAVLNVVVDRRDRG